MAWIAPVIQGIGSIAGGMLSKSGSSSANSMSNKMALRSMMFQKYMAGHAHQLEVADLRAAGLNPILSGTGGSGASASGGAQSSYENENAAGVSTALEALTKITSALLTREQTDNVKAQTENTQARTATEREQLGLVREQTVLTGANAGLASQQISNAKVQYENIQADTRLKQIGAQVSLSEIDKNHELSKLFRAQGFTESQQAQLYGVNVLQASEVLKGLRNEGEINQSDYGKIMRYIDRGLETINRIPIIGKGKK